MSEEGGKNVTFDEKEEVKIVPIEVEQEEEEEETAVGQPDSPIEAKRSKPNPPSPVEAEEEEETSPTPPTQPSPPSQPTSVQTTKGLQKSMSMAEVDQKTRDLLWYAFVNNRIQVDDDIRLDRFRTIAHYAMPKAVPHHSDLPYMYANRSYPPYGYRSSVIDVSPYFYYRRRKPDPGFQIDLPAINVARVNALNDYYLAPARRYDYRKVYPSTYYSATYYPSLYNYPRYYY